MKKLFLSLLVLTISITVFSQGEITGVITYHFNKYQGDKADIGAKVYAIDSISNPDFDFESITKFKNGKAYIGLYNSYAKMNAQKDELLKMYGNKKKNKEEVAKTLKEKESNQKKMDEFLIEMAKYDVDTQEKLDSLDKVVSNSYRNTLKNEDISSATINTTGSYSIPVKAGTYYVFIKSKNRKGLTQSEVMGKIYCEKITIKDGQTKDVSYNFRP
jgi:hypothetical protein